MIAILNDYRNENVRINERKLLVFLYKISYFVQYSIYTTDPNNVQASVVFQDLNKIVTFVPASNDIDIIIIGIFPTKNAIRLMRDTCLSLWQF